MSESPDAGVGAGWGPKMRPGPQESKPRSSSTLPEDGEARTGTDGGLARPQVPGVKMSGRQPGGVLDVSALGCSYQPHSLSSKLSSKVTIGNGPRSEPQ